LDGFKVSIRSLLLTLCRWTPELTEDN